MSDLTDRQWQRVGSRSLEVEESDGWDSLDTMATNYPSTDSGAIRCPFPRCGFARHDPCAMFKHVHFGPHGRSYGVTLQEFADGRPLQVQVW